MAQHEPTESVDTRVVENGAPIGVRGNPQAFDPIVCRQLEPVAAWRKAQGGMCVDAGQSQTGPQSKGCHRIDLR
ncbi:hypothetical protein [Paraburkholderia youngii]|uniref:hypothetical protein n=1 Tax=Paraburkholderia youngii TaxID=2782701 RepID=UPI003D1E202F